MKTSVITYNRNDGYKENERFTIHLKTLLDTFNEVNYVDWNSPTRSFLYEVIDEIPKTGRLKHFIVPPEIHNFLFKLCSSKYDFKKSPAFFACKFPIFVSCGSFNIFQLNYLTL